MESPRRRMWIGFAIAVGTTTLFSLAWESLDGWLGPGAEGLMLFGLAILASSWWGGLWPGLVATFLGCLAGAFHLLRAENFTASGSVIVFAFLGVMISWGGETLRRYRHLVQEADHTLFGRDRTESGLVDTAARHRRLFNANIIGVITVLQDGRIPDANDAFLRLVGFSRDDLREGRLNWRALTPVDSLPTEVLGTHPISRMTDQVAPVEKEFIHKEGRRIPVLIGGAFIHGLSGQGICFVLDLTDRKRAEQERDRAGRELRRNEERLRLACQVGRQGWWEHDPATGDSLISAELAEMFGLPPQQRTDTIETWRQRLHPDDQERVLRLRQEAIAQGTEYGIEYRIVRPDGKQLWIDSRGKVFRDEAGQPVRFLGMAGDITQRKRLEEALLTADRRKNEFLALLAHELRNPLAPIRNGLYLVKLFAGEGQDVEKAVEMMDRQVTQMVRLIDDLLDVGRIGQGKIHLRREQVELANVVRLAVDTAISNVEEMGHELSVRLPDRPLWLNADPVRLGQVFTNLLNNAAKFTPRGGKIGLTAEQAGAEAVIRVRDTGVGIPAEKLGSIFEMFVQVDHALERSHNGLGLGLTLVRSLVEMHGGTVQALSDGPGLGSTFEVRLPVVAPVKPVAEIDPVSPSDRASQLRILVVDDNQDSADSLSLLLNVLGHESATANDGFKALEMVESFNPQVIVCDLGMPGMSGLEVARRLRQRHCRTDLYLIALTGYGAESDRRSCEEAGFDAHLIKPIEIDALQQILARSLQENASSHQDSAKRDR